MCRSPCATAEVAASGTRAMWNRAIRAGTSAIAETRACTSVSPATRRISLGTIGLFAVRAAEGTEAATITAVGA